MILIGVVIVIGIVAFFVGRARTQKGNAQWRQQAAALLDELSDAGINLAAAQQSAIPVLAARTEGRLVQLNAQLSSLHQTRPVGNGTERARAGDQRLQHIARDAHADHARPAGHGVAGGSERRERWRAARQHGAVREAELAGGRHHRMRFGWRAVLAMPLLALVSCGGGSTEAAAASPQDLQDKMALVQQQFETEQAVLDKQRDSALDIASGGGAPGAGAPPTLFELLRDPAAFLEEAGSAAEATAGATHSPSHGRRMPMPGVRRTRRAGTPTSSSSTAAPMCFLRSWPSSTSTAGRTSAAQLVAAAEAQGLGEGMAASGDPTAGIDLNALLDRLND